MNSYNDNLNSVVVSSLQAQELENKQLNSQRIASMFTLYHAEGATINAFEKLESDEILLAAKGVVLDQAVQNGNLMTNLLASATQASTYVAQSVTNTSVAAANTQIAGNAILKLAGDMGNVFSIVNAADFDTEIYNQGKEAMELINHTAYLAEVATQTAMNASIQTSEVTSPTVLSKAKATNAQMVNLQQIVSTDFSKTLQTVLNDTTSLGSASVAEKAAEGQYEDVVAEYKASRGVYKAMNEQMNLGLSVLPIEPSSDPKKATAYVTQRDIRFDLITSPFAKSFSPSVPVPSGVKLGPDANPVATYYIMLVNEKNKTTFSLTEAEAIILKGLNNYIQINVTPSKLIPATDKQGNTTGQTFVPAVLTRVDTGDVIPVSDNRASVLVDFFNVNTNKDTLTGHKLHDSDGNPADLGTNYVVFVMAVYDSNYKRKLNSFEDFLSATSRTFRMAYLLTPAFDVTAGQIVAGDTSHDDWYHTDEPEMRTVPDTHQITFSVSENTAYSHEVQYRCIILPHTHSTMHGMLTRASTHDLEYEVNTLEQIADKFDPAINKAYDEMGNMRIRFERMGFTPFCQMTQPPTTSEQQKVFNEELKDLYAIYKTATGEEKKLLGETIKIMQAECKRIGFVPYTKDTPPPTQYTNPPTTQAEQDVFNMQFNALNDAYVNALNEKNAAMESIKKDTPDQLSFLFNLRLAEQVTPGNYILPTKFNVRENVTGHIWPVTDYFAPFGPEATDNFGNPLMAKHKYSVVVVSVSTAPAENLNMYNNNWTGNSEVIASFTYTVPESKKKDDAVETKARVRSAAAAVGRLKKTSKKNKPGKK